VDNYQIDVSLGFLASLEMLNKYKTATIPFVLALTVDEAPQILLKLKVVVLTF
jgi:hypothetical protein